MCALCACFLIMQVDPYELLDLVEQAFQIHVAEFSLEFFDEQRDLKPRSSFIMMAPKRQAVKLYALYSGLQLRKK